MQTEKNERPQEETRDIIVLDAGIGNGEEPDSVCCWVNYIPLRG